MNKKARPTLLRLVSTFKDQVWPVRIQRPLLFGLAIVLLGAGLLLASLDFIHANRDDINAISTIFIAAFTIVLGVFTVRLAGSTRIAADAAKEAAETAKIQASIAQRSLTDLERPYLFIFGVANLKSNDNGENFFVEYTIANYGKMPAIIDGAWIDFVIDNVGEPPPPTLLWEGHQLLASPILQPGEKREHIRAYTPTGMTNGIAAVAVLNIDEAVDPEVISCPNFMVPDGFDVYFRATIAYRGPFSAGHETGALWLYMPGNFEFVARGGGQYNYVR